MDGIITANTCSFGVSILGTISLSLGQVTAILNGERVLSHPRDIAEVRNAYETYYKQDELDLYSANNLLTACGIMTCCLVREYGAFRTQPVGIVDSEEHILHFGTLSQYIPVLVTELLGLVMDIQIHMLIYRCAFHYEFNLIHPFANSPGRVGYLWHTLLLFRCKSSFCLAS